MIDTRYDLMNVDELAQLLIVSPGVAYKLCMTGEIEAMKVGRQWRISHEAYENYIRRKSKLAG